jgi:hypothetical protein
MKFFPVRIIRPLDLCKHTTYVLELPFFRATEMLRLELLTDDKLQEIQLRSRWNINRNNEEIEYNR